MIYGSFPLGKSRAYYILTFVYAGAARGVVNVNQTPTSARDIY
jgi:hypothetical protein